MNHLTNNTIHYLFRLEPSAQTRVRAESRLVEYPMGTVLQSTDNVQQGFMTVLEGVLRVQNLSPSGRELLLYRLEPGQSCVLLLSLLQVAELVAETDVKVSVLPLSSFESLQAESHAFRQLVQETFARRLSHVVGLASKLAHERVDVRLAHCLLQRTTRITEICATHEELARELGTAREVVSRLLKHFERMGWIELRRGLIMLHERAQMSAWATNASRGSVRHFGDTGIEKTRKAS